MKQKQFIRQETIDGHLIKCWDSLYSIEHKTGFNHSSISLCVNGKRSQAYGFKWKRVILYENK